MRKRRKIATDCEKATFLIEKSESGLLSFRENLELHIHLAGCSVCRIFQQQSRLINVMAKNIFKMSAAGEAKLDKQFKQELQENIEEKINRD